VIHISDQSPLFEIKHLAINLGRRGQSMTVIQLKTSDLTGALSSVAEGAGPQLPRVLQRATLEARRDGLRYSGNVPPEEAWKLFLGGQAHLIDVRTAEERKFVGYVPNTLHISWQADSAQLENSDFIRELHNILPRNAVILFLCRSGKRSAAAAATARLAGFLNVFSVKEGVDGDPNHAQDHNIPSGWRQRGLPWVRN
jgi:rhodanese-related sulfurtransferase